MDTNKPYKSISNFSAALPTMVDVLQKNPVHFLANLKVQHSNMAPEVGFVANESIQSPFANFFYNGTLHNDRSNFTINQGLSSCYEIR